MKENFEDEKRLSIVLVDGNGVNAKVSIPLPQNLSEREIQGILHDLEVGRSLDDSRATIPQHGNCPNFVMYWDEVSD